MRRVCIFCWVILATGDVYGTLILAYGSVKLFRRHCLLKRMLHLARTILSQNYLSFQIHTYTQNEGRAMGAPTSANPFRSVLTVY
jgi:hypothetical protein